MLVLPLVPVTPRGSSRSRDGRRSARRSGRARGAHARDRDGHVAEVAFSPAPLRPAARRRRRRSWARSRSRDRRVTRRAGRRRGHPARPGGSRGGFRGPSGPCSSVSDELADRQGLTGSASRGEESRIIPPPGGRPGPPLLDRGVVHRAIASFEHRSGTRELGHPLALDGSEVVISEDSTPARSSRARLEARSVPRWPAATKTRSKVSPVAAGGHDAPPATGMAAP